MPRIELLDQITIDKIAAGEVIERPASVIKELVENAIDAGATSIITEVEEGGITLMRITDNGCGIAKDQVPHAFLRHSTSKIHSAEDLFRISSLGFRGEALSSIAAVSQVELITKPKEDLFGSRYMIEGGKEKGLEETGAPDGTTFMIRQLFYNTPARRKFLKTAMTEASHISDLITRLALSHPEISFQFINNHQSKLHTSGNGNVKDVIYHVYGREVANHLIPLEFEKGGLKITGFLGEPLISRGNRNFENYFVNGRYVKSAVLSKAIEDAYKDFTMQHKYPFVVLQLHMEQDKIDINVHPTKMELRFSNQQEVYNLLYEAVRKGLHHKQLIPEVEVPAPPVAVVREEPAPRKTTEPEEKNINYFMEKMKNRVLSYHKQESQAEVQKKDSIWAGTIQADRVKETANYRKEAEKSKKTERTPLKTEHALQKTECAPENKKTENQKTEHDPESIQHYPQSSPQIQQLDLFEEKILTKEARQSYKIIGQVFDTYWLVQFLDSLYIIDQHAAHERVLYERTLAEMKKREYTAQYLSPPLILSLSMQERDTLEQNMERFTSIGFEIEHFGGEEYAVRAVPANLFSIAKSELMLQMLDALGEGLSTALAPEMIDEKIASMSCKAAVKGNSRLSQTEVDSLINELLTLENPYHCPHGRPTIISMTKKELEKKFKRIV